MQTPTRTRKKLGKHDEDLGLWTKLRLVRRVARDVICSLVCKSLRINEMTKLGFDEISASQLTRNASHAMMNA